MRTRKVVFLRRFALPEGLPTPMEVLTEIEDMRDVLLGRVEPPVRGDLALMEVADAYFARICEIESLIHAAVRDKKILPNSALEDIRKKELRLFKEIAKSAADLGSRRLTAASLRWEMEKLGKDL